MSAQGAVLENSAPGAEQRPIYFLLHDLSLTLGFRTVLDGVSFDLRRGEILGLLGPNGSGKSSLLRCLTGLYKPTCSFSVDGEAMRPGSQAFRRQLGVVFQQDSLDEKLTARENLHLAGMLYGLKADESKERIAELLSFVELESRANEAVNTYSGGMRRRLELARALIHNPSILLLDEPTTGLDPYAFEKVWSRLEALRNKRGLTILLSTHRSDEAQRCDRLAVMDEGRILRCDTPEHLLQQVAGDVLIVKAKNLESVARMVKERFGLTGRIEDEKYFLEQEQGHTFIPELASSFEPGELLSIELRRPNLNDVFFHVTGHSMTVREEESVHD